MTSSDLPSELPEHLSEGLAQSFDYVTLDIETRIIVQQCVSEIKQRVQDTLKATWEIGQKLFEIRERLGYGLFDSWLKSEFQWSRRTAYNYISIFESFSCASIAQLKIAPTTLYLLAADTTPQEARTEAIERALAGEKITESKAKALIKQYKQSAAPKVIKQITLDVAAETVEESVSSAELALDPMENSPLDTDQFEQELLGKELDKKPLFESSNSEQAIPSDALNGSIKDQKAIQMEEENTSVTKIYKNLNITLEYLYREDLLDLIDPLSLKSLIEKLTLLVEKSQVSLKRRFDSTYSNN